MLAILVPGQGAQRSGFLTPWLEAPGAAELVGHHSEIVGIDLIAAGTTMSDSDITDTAVAQPLLAAAGLLSAASLPPLPSGTVFAGHSVGEIAAAALAGALSLDDALRIVAIRGTAMAAAAHAQPGGMLAVLGGDPLAVADAIAVAGCSIANVNAAGQVVAAGPVAAIERLLATPPSGAWLRPLAVAGAFHTSLMAPARDALAATAHGVRVEDAPGGLLSNADGTLVTDGPQIMRRLVEQVCAPVRWDACMTSLTALGVTATIELAPGGTLTALVRRELPGMSTVALRTPADLPAAHDLIEEHRTELAEESPPWRLVVSPTRGTVHVTATTTGGSLDAGDVLGQVSTRTEEVTVRVDHNGRLVEWLVHDGDPVTSGQPLARIALEAVA